MYVATYDPYLPECLRHGQDEIIHYYHKDSPEFWMCSAIDPSMHPSTYGAKKQHLISCNTFWVRINKEFALTDIGPNVEFGPELYARLDRFVVGWYFDKWHTMLSSYMNMLDIKALVEEADELKHRVGLLDGQ